MKTPKQWLAETEKLFENDNDRETFIHAIQDDALATQDSIWHKSYELAASERDELRATCDRLRHDLGAARQIAEQILALIAENK